MPRLCCLRRVGGQPPSGLFKPAGIPTTELELVEMTLDELEALRLVDHEGLQQDAAGDRMGVSRQTLGRILGAARRKVAGALVQGRALRIEGGPVQPGRRRKTA